MGSAKGPARRGQAAQKRFEARGGEGVYDPERRAAAMRTLEIKRRDFENGKAGALMEAVAMCVLYEINAPDWVAREIVLAVLRRREISRNSWDEILGTPYPKSASMAAIKKHRLELRQVMLCTLKLHEQSAPKRYPIGDNFFAEIAAAVPGLGPDTAKRRYYEARKLMQTSEVFAGQIRDLWNSGVNAKPKSGSLPRTTARGVKPR
jgi:hypothetical protein